MIFKWNVFLSHNLYFKNPKWIAPRFTKDRMWKGIEVNLIHVTLSNEKLKN